MAAKTLSFETGLVEYDINGAVTVRFNPTDAGFVDRLYSAFTELDARQDEFRREVGEIGGDGGRLFAYARERDAEMRAVIDGLLGEGVADALFPDMNCYALADGLPVWINLMLAVAGEVEAAFESEQGKGDPRIKAVSDRSRQKYAAMLEKYKGKK